MVSFFDLRPRGFRYGARVVGKVWPQVVPSNEVLPKLCIFAETLKACALIGLHLLAAGYEVG